MSFLPFKFGAARDNLATIKRSRVIKAPLADVWKVIEDPHQMPRWWPRVERMEGVDETRFTQVFKTKRSRTVRADFRLLASEPPGEQYASGHRTWTQDVEGTPFEPVLRESITEIAVDPVDDGARVTIAQRQRLRGYSKTGALAMRSVTAKRLDEALKGLERLF